MADGSEFAFPAAPSVNEREDLPPLDWLPAPLRRPSYLDDSFQIYQPLGQTADNKSYISDESYGDRFRAYNMPMFFPDMYPVTTPVDLQFREYSMSDPGAPDYAEWHSMSGSRERSDFWHDSPRTSFEAASSVGLADVSSQTQSSYHTATNDSPTRSSTRPQSLDISTGNDETSLAPASTPGAPHVV